MADGALASQVEPYLDDQETLFVSTSLQFELYKWAKREKGEVEALEAVALTEQGVIVPLTTSLALHAADLALEHQLSFADAVVYASAREALAPLVTSDDHFDTLQDVIYFSKKNA